MQVRIALIALAGALSLPVLAGPPHLTPYGTNHNQAAKLRSAAPTAVASAAGVDAAGWLHVGGEEGYRFVGTDRQAARMPSTQARAGSAAAGASDGWVAVGGEEGARFVPQATTLMRATVQHDAMHARHMPSAVDGWLVVGGELGAVYTGTASPKAALQAYAPAGYIIHKMQMPDGTPCMMAG